jgi:CBS domain-containing protein
LAHSQTTVFRRQVRDHMQPPPAVVPPHLSTLESVARMRAAGASVAVAVDERRGVIGILTEQDVTRRIAGRSVGVLPVLELMTRPVATVGADRPLCEAVGMMRRLRLRHMPVVDGAGSLVGMLYLHDALAAANPELVGAIDRLTHETSLEGLREVKAAQVQLAADLFADRVPTPEIQSLISAINNDIHRRVIGLNLDALRAEGQGSAPVTFCAIVMGSGSRGESFLFPDQDNGFILQDYPDAEHDAVDAFFIELAARTTRQLDELGYPLCRGGVMAINPVWRKSLGQWREQVTRWVRSRSEIAMRLCDILFDFQGVYGSTELADGLRRHILGLIQTNHAFLRSMFGIQAEHRAGLGWFNRLRTERRDRHHKGEVNLKYAGTLPLAEAVRLLALRHAIDATGTLARIDELAARDLLGRDEEDDLRAAFEHITRLQLRQQIADFRAGRPVGNFVAPASLTRGEIHLLKRSFQAINRFRTRLRVEITGEVL